MENILKPKYEVMLRRIVDEIALFLELHGGFANGYETYCKGSIKTNVHSAMEWKTPTQGKMTFDEARKIGWELNAKLREILQSHKYNDYVRIECYFDQHGTWHSNASMTYSLPISLPFNFERNKE